MIRRSKIFFSAIGILLLAEFTGQSFTCRELTEPAIAVAPEGQVITVGHHDADISGTDNLAIQAAVDLLNSRGGGTVVILPGEYILNNSIYLRSNVNISGDKKSTVLKRCPALSSRLLVDADRFQKEITPADPSLFKPGMGIICRSNNLMNVMTDDPFTITAIEDGKLFVNHFILHDFTADTDSQGEGGHNGLVANVFPMLLGSCIENVTIDGLTIDAQTEENPGWQNVRTAGILFATCENSVIRNVRISHVQGDGMTIAHGSKNITVENCETSYNTYHGIHPGSHSTFITVKNCHMHHNGSDGLYICWGIKNSRFLDNIIHHNGIRKVGKRNGISIGHKDTDNLISGNHIFENAISGIHFRKKTEANGAHFNTITDNVIENNGLPEHTGKGYGIYINGITHDLIIKNNTIRETRSGNERFQKTGIFISTGASRVHLMGNDMNGHADKDVIDESGK